VRASNSEKENSKKKKSNYEKAKGPMFDGEEDNYDQ